MSTKTKPARSPSQTTPTARCSAIFNYDRITLWLSHPELPIALEKLKKHCTDAKFHVQQMPFNAFWKARLEIFQPTRRCLRLLAKALGNEISTLPTYVELACDLLANSEEQAQRWCDDFFATARGRYQRHPVVRNGTVRYIGDRYNHHGARRPNKVMVAYCDRPSKLNNAQPDERQPPDLHIEFRASGTTTLSALGICSLDDLLQFDHRRFWDRHIQMFELPPQPTALGRLLATASGADTDVSGTALRRRAARWMAKHSVDGKFVMHNALRATPKLVPMLNSVPFSVWIEHVMAPVPADCPDRY